MSLSYHWYAIYTRSRGEKVTAKLLSDQGIEAYLPLQRKLRQWSDRKKWVEVPYINSYVFVMYYKEQMCLTVYSLFRLCLISIHVK